MKIIYERYKYEWGICKNGVELYAQKGTTDYFHNEKCESNCLPINIKKEQ